jgi:uncharacterized iron-regulated membrane protein
MANISAVAASKHHARPWLDYRAVWRWHFYAGLFAIPFIIWLSITGSIYLFHPQIDRWLDRSFDHLTFTGPLENPARQVEAALAAVPGSNLHYYQLPRTSNSASQIIVGRGPTEYRVYVNPQTLAVMKTIEEEHRPMRILFHLHGELLMGARGSNVIELAASWTIVLIFTGLYLWWPRQSESLAGVLYLRLREGKRIFWRDLHSVTAVWICAWALFLLFSGLPWAAGWGGYLKKVRSLAGTAVVRQDWTTGSNSELEQRMALNRNSLAGSAVQHSEHMTHMGHVELGPDAYAPLAKMIATVAPLDLPFPVLISPPIRKGGPWTSKSDVANRPERVNLTLDPNTGAVLQRQGFRQSDFIDKVVAVVVAAHEGQLFGLANQIVGLGTAVGLILVCVSSIVMWWRRRDAGVLGAPVAIRRPRVSFGLITVVVLLGVYLPMMGCSLIVVLLMEHLILRRIPATRHWLGLRMNSSERS